MKPTPFPWPNGARAALSLTFDDARLSQIDCGLPILDRHGIRATFYVSPEGVQQRLPAWRQAIARGHEIGNHTFTHPCSENFAFVRENGNPLETMALKALDADIRRANTWIRKQLGVTPHTFAYPCGQMAVGRGAGTRSYVPLVAKRFLAGRGYRDEQHNHPRHCDLVKCWAMEADGRRFAHLRAWLAAAAQDGGWLVLAAHNVGEKARQTLSATVLDELCAYVARPANGIWVDTVAEVAKHIDRQRREDAACIKSDNRKSTRSAR